HTPRPGGPRCESSAPRTTPRRSTCERRVGEDRRARVGWEVQPLDVQLEIAHCGQPEVPGARVVKGTLCAARRGGQSLGLRQAQHARTSEPQPASPTTKEQTVQITRNSIQTTPGPSDWFTGAVYIDAVAMPSEPFRMQAASVHFTPGARTAWHTHPNGQTIYVTEGVGLCQRRGGPVEVIRPGDRVFFEAGEDHWHGATPNRFMTHLAMQPVDEAGPAAGRPRHPLSRRVRRVPPRTEPAARGRDRAPPGDRARRRAAARAATGRVRPGRLPLRGGGRRRRRGEVLRAVRAGKGHIGD